MAPDSPKPTASAGQQISAFFHSLLLFILDILHQALNIFSRSRRKHHTHTHATRTTTGSTYASTSSSQTQDGTRTMVYQALTSSGFQQQPTPHSVRALPRLPARRPGNVAADEDIQPRLTARFSRLVMHAARDQPVRDLDGDLHQTRGEVHRGRDKNPHQSRVQGDCDIDSNPHQREGWTDNRPKGKENKRPPVSSGAEPELGIERVQGPDGMVEIIARLSYPAATKLSGQHVIPKPPSHYTEEEKAFHMTFVDAALDMARLALRTCETPVGCVIVHKGRIIARGMNATNATRNGTRHAELMALCALLSYAPESDLEEPGTASSDTTDDKIEPEDACWGDVDPSDGHLFPYGQKLHPSPRVNQNIIAECSLYVTVEPCIMCASMLRQLRIKKVYFGAVNDKFGGTGGVFRIHQNSPPVYEKINTPVHQTTVLPRQSPRSQDGTGTVRPSAAPTFYPASNATDDSGDFEDDSDDQVDNAVVKEDPAGETPLEGHGGNIEPGFEAEGGWGRDVAVGLLRQFYVQENNRAPRFEWRTHHLPAPVPRKKEGRAARLAAILARSGHAGGGPLSDTMFANRGYTTMPGNQSSTSLDTLTDESSDDPESMPQATEVGGGYDE